MESLIVDIEALFAGLEPQPGGDGYTTAEIIAKTGMSPELARRRIRQALEEGRCQRGVKVMESIDGRRMRVPAYVFSGTV